ncbi:Metallo-dependent phosphatase [Conidiobolus coronatus NRRL 28638]|uniref:Metallo-dependent phosphatase n=1 Tax=Conidiobolus coronatus (strain ATCC 28846 / CBS 209.66 / NRRL 28638) TaxID=796925 RepID=A0A137NZC4_CONC2|nr:Metallo-dependent phosphatase [Conidiobolus coronatus NRRL 28638]|eukprot:KXN68190.1 Metallo-dependent phosphatase [Conidiobolus coronatus NRRL 28638]
MNLIFTAILLSLAESRFVKRHTPGNYDLSIIHTNDIHSHYDQANKFGTDCTEAQITAKQCYGGVPRLKAVIDQLRREHPNSLLLDAGDQFQGTLFYGYYKGNITAEIMNLLKYDAMAIGNHEFDDGPDNIARVAKNFKFPIISANIDASKNPKLASVLKPYTIIEKYNLGIIGYITPSLASISNSGPTIKVLDPIAPVQKAIDELKAKGIKRIIALSHNGLSLIVGGHSHTYLAPQDNPNASTRPESGGLYPTEVKNLENENTYVVQVYCWGRFLGHVDINFKDNGYLKAIEGSPIEMGDDVKPDEATQKLVQKWRKPFDEMTSEVIGVVTKEFEQCTYLKEECAIGNLITDIMLESRKSINTDIALINSGAMRYGLVAGEIKMKDVLIALPFGNSLADVELPGSKVWEILEGVVSGENLVSHRNLTTFVQVSGMKFKYDPKQQKGQKLISIEIKDTKTGKFGPIELSKVYKMVTLDFIASGVNGIIAPGFKDVILLDQLDILFSDYIKKVKTITPTLEGRIQVAAKGSN